MPRPPVPVHPSPGLPWHLPDQEGDEQDGGQDHEGEDPERDQDGDPLRGVAAVCMHAQTVTAVPASAAHPAPEPLPQPTSAGGAQLLRDPRLPRSLYPSGAPPALTAPLSPVWPQGPRCRRHSPMGSGLGAGEGSWARRSRPVSVVVSALAVTAGSGGTGGDRGRQLVAAWLQGVPSPLRPRWGKSCSILPRMH